MSRSIADGMPKRVDETPDQPGIGHLPVAKKRPHRVAGRRRNGIDAEPRVRRLSRAQRVSIWRYLSDAPVAYLLAAPVIYGMILPLVILDASVTVYQHVCFRIYGIPRVSRRAYLVFDRHRLPYLNAIEKLHCLYCGYASQLFAYAREINARTEQFFCPIKHASGRLDAHERSENFFAYGDARAYHRNLETIRKDWNG